MKSGRLQNRRLRGSPLEAVPAVRLRSLQARARAVRQTLGVYLTQQELSALKNRGRR